MRACTLPTWTRPLQGQEPLRHRRLRRCRPPPCPHHPCRRSRRCRHAAPSRSPWIRPHRRAPRVRGGSTCSQVRCASNAATCAAVACCRRLQASPRASCLDCATASATRRLSYRLRMSAVSYGSRRSTWRRRLQPPRRLRASAAAAAPRAICRDARRRQAARRLATGPGAAANRLRVASLRPSLHVAWVATPARSAHSALPSGASSVRLARWRSPSSAAATPVRTTCAIRSTRRAPLG